MKISLPGLKGNLYYSAFAANLASTAIGTHYSWSSPTLPQLQAQGSWLRLDADQASWVGSLAALGTVAGPFLGAWLMDRIGRRRSIMLSVVISVVAWVVLLTAHSVWQLYVGRVIGGMGGGIAFLVCPVYVAEIAEPDVRGALGSMFAFFLVGGYLIEYGFGPYVSYSTLIILNFIPAVIFFLTFSLAPESPYYFLRKNNFSKAMDSLTWLRSGRQNEEVQRELNEIQATLGAYFYFRHAGRDMSAFGWLPVTSLVLFILCYTVGFGPLPWAVMAEVFPSNVKALAAAITASFCWLLGFVITKFFTSVSTEFGAHIAFFIFSLCCVAALLFTVLLLPDTRGLTLQEILDLLNKTPLVSSRHNPVGDPKQSEEDGKTE